MSETLTEQNAVQETAAPVADESILNKLGSQAAELARAVGRVLRDADSNLKDIAMLCLQARLTIPKRLSNGLWVHDWDGNTAEYRTWYESHVLAVLQEQAPVVTFAFQRDDGEAEERAIGDTDWVQRAQRTIRYYVAENRGSFMREHGFENEATKFPTPLDLTPPSVKAAERYAESRRRAANPTPPQERVTQVIKDLDENRENAVLILDMLRSIAEQTDERLSVATIESLTKAQGKKVATAITNVQTILDAIIKRMAQVEEAQEAA